MNWWYVACPAEIEEIRVRHRPCCTPYGPGCSCEQCHAPWIDDDGNEGCLVVRLIWAWDAQRRWLITKAWHAPNCRGEGCSCGLFELLGDDAPKPVQWDVGRAEIGEES